MRTNIYPVIYQGTIFEDDVPVLKVGYVRFLGGCSQCVMCVFVCLVTISWRNTRKGMGVSKSEGVQVLLTKLDTLLLKVEMITIFRVHLQENSLHCRVMCCNPQFWTQSQEMLLRYGP